jgi:hypothetical protein
MRQYVSNSHANNLHPFLKFYEGMKYLLLFKNDEKHLWQNNMVKVTTHGCSNEYII